MSGRWGKMYDWPKAPTRWMDGGTQYISVPFTWNLPALRAELQTPDLFGLSVVVGGPAVKLMPDYLRGLDSVVVHTGDIDGVLQRVNPRATRTSFGCPNQCRFCAVPTVEGALRELAEWPQGHVICDNNLLACSMPHFHRVMDMADTFAGCDFQGVDARLLTAEHAQRFARLRRPILRMAIDHTSQQKAWRRAFDLLCGAGVAKAGVRVYVLCGWRSTPVDAWQRCEYVEERGALATPLWFHPLDALEHNAILPVHRQYGWNACERDRIMQYYYQHRGQKPPLTGAT